MDLERVDDTKNSIAFGGTIEYMAPEMMQRKQCGASIDWFSFGIVLFELLCGENPFKDTE